MTVILQHEIDTPPGSVVAWLEERHLPYRICRLFAQDPLPQLQEFDQLIICGGSMNVDQEHLFPWLREEKKLISNCVKSQKKMVGLCLGGQLLAETLGAEVGPMNFSEVGWVDMDLKVDLKAAATLLSLKVFQWHSYCFKEVPGTIPLATNAAWKYQAFQFENFVVGFQFHPEATVQWIQECAQDKNLPQGPFCQNSEQMKQGLIHQARMQQFFFDFLDQFFLRSPLK